MPKGDGQGKGGGPKIKTETERQMILAEVAKLDRRGYTQIEICKELARTVKIRLSQPAISGYLKLLRETYKAQQIEYRKELVAEKLEQYKEVRREAWAAWERSKNPSKKRVREKVARKEKKQDPPKRGGAANLRPIRTREAADSEESMRLLKEIVTKEGRLPANTYLQTILQTLDAECHLIGLNKEVPQVNVNLFTKLSELLTPMAAVDPVEVELNRKGLVTPAIEPATSEGPS